MTTPNLPALVQCFFTDRLQVQLGASSHTIASYRDTFRLLFVFASTRLDRTPSQLRVEDLSAVLISAFLEHLEHQRTNTPKTRNTRLAAVRAFFRFVAFAEPVCSLQCQQVLAIPNKRHERLTVEFLTTEEAKALVATPDATTWMGRRDRTLLRMAVQTGLRSAEIRSLRRRDVNLGVGAHVRCLGKGRKTRCTPLRSDVASALEAWLLERVCEPDAPVFPSLRGGFLSADALQSLVSRHVAAASATCSSLVGRSITPHSLRHYVPFRTMSRTSSAVWFCRQMRTAG